jgi:hypothetical protein
MNPWQRLLLIRTVKRTCLHLLFEGCSSPQTAASPAYLCKLYCDWPVVLGSPLLASGLLDAPALGSLSAPGTLRTRSEADPGSQVSPRMTSSPERQELVSDGSAVRAVKGGRCGVGAIE